jgi:hypothetical protein
LPPHSQTLVTEIATTDDLAKWDASARARGLVRVVIFSEKSRAPAAVREVALGVSATAAVAHVRYRESRREARRIARRLGVGTGPPAPAQKKKNGEMGKSVPAPLAEHDLPVVAALREPGLPRSIGRRVDLRADLGAWVAQRAMPNVVALTPETAREACIERRCVLAVLPAGAGANAAGEAMREPHQIKGKGKGKGKDTGEKATESPVATTPAAGLLRSVAAAVAAHNADVDRKHQRERRATGNAGRKASRPAGLIQGVWIDAGEQPMLAAAVAKLAAGSDRCVCGGHG